MQARYYTHAAYLKGGDRGVGRGPGRSCGRLGRRPLREGRRRARAAATGRFDPASQVFAGADRHYTSSRDYQAQVYDMIETDLDEALAEGGSPVKAAQEVLRILRDQLRSVIEFGGLSLESYIDFQSNVRGRINRLEAGPAAAALPAAARPARRRRGPDPLGPGPRGRPRRTTVGWPSARPQLDQPIEVDGQRRRARPPRPAVAGPLELAAAQPALRQGPADPAQLRGHRGGQRGHQRGLPPLRRRGPPPAATSHCSAC